MDRETVILEYKTGLISMGEALGRLVPQGLLFSARRAMQEAAFRDLTGEEPLVNKEGDCTEAYFKAIRERLKWIDTQPS